MKSIKIGLLFAAVVLVAGCVTEQTYKTEVADVSQLTTLNQKLTSELGADTAQIQQMQDELKVTLVNSVLFSEGGYELHSAGKAALAKIAPTLAALKGPQIAVRGYTDNEPIGGALKERFPSNVALSSGRADAVVAYLTQKGVPAGIMSAQGFGDADPMAGNDTAEGRAKNRRVEIVITNFPPQ